MLDKSQKMLTWVLGVHDTGFYNQSINNIYKKVINIVNGFLIIALLVIAVAWNFSFLISTKNLRRMLFLFAFISIIINFTLSIGRLGIDLAETVQGSFLTKINGERIQADDLIAINIDSNWVGKAKNSWTPLDLPNQTEWEIIDGPTVYSDFNEQHSKGVQITPKGTVYLDTTDCEPTNRNNCASNIDCTILYLPDNCMPDKEFIVATCDNQNPAAKWVWMKIKCKNTN